jgi:hypothetical protein
MASLFAKAGVQTRQPSDRLFLVESVYSWRLLDELAVAAYWVRDYATSKAACQALLEKAEQGLAIPDHELERIRGNLAGANERLAAAEQS